MTMSRVALATAHFSYRLIPRTSFVLVRGKVVPCIPRLTSPPYAFLVFDLCGSQATSFKRPQIFASKPGRGLYSL